MAPLPPIVDTAWKSYVALQKKSLRYQKFIAPEINTTILGSNIRYRKIALDPQSATYAKVMEDWNTSGQTSQPSQNLTTLKYTVETKGSPPTDGSGYPLFLAMHGGGQAPPGDNDEQWLYMMGFYKAAISQGIYVSLRGVGNSWYLHYTTASYILIERLIENFILFGNVNPDKVYILGFSAGGDGVYRIAPRLAQRFSSVNAGGGHPGDVRFDNMANVPICLQVGEYDSKYDRSKSVAGAAIAIDGLKSKYPNEPSLYQKEIFIHQPDYPERFDINNKDQEYVFRHWDWEAYNATISAEVYPTRGWKRVLNEYKDWYDTFPKMVPGKTHFADTSAINWMITRPGGRSLPQRVVWDLREGEFFGPAAFSNFSGRGMDGKGRSQNYWLDIGRYTRDYVGDLIEASINKSANAITVVRAQKYLRILLVPGMLAQPSKPVIVNVASQSMSVQVKWDNPVVVAETLGRNDPTLVFTGDIVLVQRQDRSWTVDTAVQSRL